MRIVGLVRARNERWILSHSARVALSWCDELVLLNHVSVDGTMELALQLAAETGRVHVLHDPDPRWHEMAQLNRMLATARYAGATHVAIVDADEVLTANLVPVIRGYADLLEAGEVLRVPWHNCWRSCDVYRDDLSKHGKQRVSLVFRDQPRLHWPEVEQYNHRSPVGIWAEKLWPAERGGGGVMHLQRVVWARAVARQRLYKIREVLEHPGAEPIEVIDARYSSSLTEDGAVLKPVPEAWWAHGLDRGLIDLEAVSWEAAEAERLLAEYGAARFAGLSL